jgi:hypothetical protein
LPPRGLALGIEAEILFANCCFAGDCGRYLSQWIGVRLQKDCSGKPDPAHEALRGAGERPNFNYEFSITNYENQQPLQAQTPRTNNNSVSRN